MKRKYDIDTALRAIMRNSNCKQTSYGYLIKNGTIGIETLGAVDYLNQRGYIIIIQKEA